MTGLKVFVENHPASFFATIRPSLYGDDDCYVVDVVGSPYYISPKGELLSCNETWDGSYLHASREEAEEAVALYMLKQATV